jgi:hypothetical protein
MKKYLLLLGALCYTSFSFAQGDYTPSTTNRFEVGLKAGLNNTWIIIDNELQNNEHHNHQFMIKPLGGASIGMKFTDNASLMLEGFYSRQGAKFDLTDGNDGGNKIGEKEIKLDYLVVPLLIKYTSVGETRFAFQIGGQMAFLLSGEETNTFDKSGTIENSYTGGPRAYTQGKYLLATTDADKETPETGKFNKKDFNVVADIGLERELSESAYISLGLRLAYGFKDIRAEEVQASPYDLDKFTLRYNVTGGLHAGIHWFL